MEAVKLPSLESLSFGFGFNRSVDALSFSQPQLLLQNPGEHTVTVLVPWSSMDLGVRHQKEGVTAG